MNKWKLVYLVNKLIYKIKKKMKFIKKIEEIPYQSIFLLNDFGDGSKVSEFSLVQKNKKVVQVYL